MTELSEHLAQLAARDLDAAQALAEAASEPIDRALGRAIMALHRGDGEAACQSAAQARALGAGAPAEQYLAAAYAMLGDPERAIASARAAVALDARPRSRTTLGSLLLAAGQVEEAAAVLRQVVADDPHDREAHLNLASAAVRLGDHGTAMSGYARAFELDPSDRRPIRHLMEMFAGASGSAPSPRSSCRAKARRRPRSRWRSISPCSSWSSWSPATIRGRGPTRAPIGRWLTWSPTPRRAGPACSSSRRAP